MNPLVALVASLVVLCGDSFAVDPSKPRDRTAPRADEPNAFQFKALTGLNYQDHIIHKTVNGESLEMILILPKEKQAADVDAHREEIARGLPATRPRPLGLR